ncbi:MAG TPA: response regulator [Gammaproteobacteria bacterium]|nr:response regulator [Gammaproteobacteria bacterium]
MKQQARVYIVDDDSGVRDGLQMLFESAGHTVSAFSTAEKFLQCYEPGAPCCLVLDLRMPGFSGLQLQELLARQELPPPIIFLTGHGNVPAAVKALKAGAMDFFQKPVINEQQLLDRVNEAIRQDCEARAEAIKREDFKQLLEQLTPREMEVMERVCEGEANKVIGIELGISERTVELHRAHMMKKLGVHSVAELIHFRDSFRDL